MTRDHEAAEVTRASLEVDLPTSSDPREDATSWYFLHIPRTGGSTLRGMLRDRFAGQVCPAGHWHELLAMPNDVRSAFSLYQGHFYSSLRRVVARDLRVITFVRDPIERSLSHYAHVVSDPHHYLHVRARELETFSAFLEDPVTSPLITNFQVRALAQDFDVVSEALALSDGDLQQRQIQQIVETTLPPDGSDASLLEDALEAVDRLAFVGITERYDESLRRLAPMLGLRADVPVRESVPGSNRLHARDLDRRTAANLREHVRLDQILYDHVRDRLPAEDAPLSHPIAAQRRHSRRRRQRS